MNQLEQLKKVTTVVADSSDFEDLEKYKPQDTTTNPSLIYKSAKLEKYKHLVEKAVFHTKGISKKEKLENALDNLFLNFGLEILKKIPGRVSIEVDARLSFDVEKTKIRAKKIINLFEKNGVDRERILIKLASTWEGILAARDLEKENIKCNMTLLFSIYQAVFCAKASATLISPFVGRILDWHLQNSSKKEFRANEDPGVVSVKNIYNYYKKFGYKTKIMGASFRSKEQIVELMGCDLLTIAPSFLKELENDNSKITKKLCLENAKSEKIEKIEIDEKKFRYLLCHDPMASEKLYDGIRKFSKDIENLENIIFPMLG